MECVEELLYVFPFLRTCASIFLFAEHGRSILRARAKKMQQLVEELLRLPKDETSSARRIKKIIKKLRIFPWHPYSRDKIAHHNFTTFD